MKKNRKVIIGLALLVVIIILVILYFLVFRKSKKTEIIDDSSKYRIQSSYEYDYVYIKDYNTYKDYINGKEVINELNESNFDGNKLYLVISEKLDSCSEEIVNNKLVSDSKNKVYFDYSTRCGGCAPINYVYSFVVIEEKEVEIYYKIIDSEECDENIDYKPMIYIYPENDIDLSISLSKPNNLLHTYPKYENSWNVKVSKNGNIYDYKTNRNYYGLYWEGNDNYKLNMDEGFVFEGKDSSKFLEDKLSILGLNDYEINEFIVYWIDKMENNKYNFVRFRTKEEIDESMGLEFSTKPDTLIRIMMDIKPLDEFISVKEQELVKVQRKGFSVIEWGGSIHE